jgi:hypothetical protein
MIACRAHTHTTSVKERITQDQNKGLNTVTVASGSQFTVGDIVMLSLNENNNLTLAQQEVAPHTLAASFTLLRSKVQFVEYHTITAVNGNVITFKEVLNKTVDASLNWELVKVNMLENVGLSNIRYEGRVPLPFNHHGELNIPGTTKRPAFEYDSGWTAFELTGVRNAVVYNNIFKDLSICTKTGRSQSVSLLLNTYTSSNTNLNARNSGHIFNLISSSSGIFKGLSNDQSLGIHHAEGYSSFTTGSVVWRSTSPLYTGYNPDNYNASGVETHAGQPRYNLHDKSIGGIIGVNGGGASSNLPHHLEGLVMWNYTTRSSAPLDLFKTSSIWGLKLVRPVFVGLTGTTLVSNSENIPDNYLINESEGQFVKEESLYEEQLKFRLGILPVWIDELKNEAKTTALELSPSKMLVEPGATFTIKGFNYPLTPVLPANLVFNSLDTNIASVDASGNVTILKEGTIEIEVINGVNKKNVSVESRYLKASDIYRVEKVQMRENESLREHIPEFVRLIDSYDIEVIPNDMLVDEADDYRALKPGRSRIKFTHKNNASITNSIPLIVNSANTPGAVQFVEDLSKVPFNGTTAYPADVFVYTGNNGHMFSFGGRVEYPSGIERVYFNKGSAFKSVTAIPTGVDIFKVDVVNRFNTSDLRTVILEINGVEKGRIDISDGTVHTFEVDNIGISGAFNFVIRNAESSLGNIAINNIRWTPPTAADGTTNILPIKAIKFNGTNNYAESSNNGYFSYGPYNDFTTDFWVSAPSNSKGVIYNEGWSASTYRTRYAIEANASNLRLFIVNRAGVAKLDLTVTGVFDNKWKHVALVHRAENNLPNGHNTRLKVFVDGVLAAITSYEKPTFDANYTESGTNGVIDRMGIGRSVRISTGSTASFFNGKLSRLRNWRRALSELEILENVSQTKDQNQLALELKMNGFVGNNNGLYESVTGANLTLEGAMEASHVVPNIECEDLPTVPTSLHKKTVAGPNFSVFHNQLTHKLILRFDEAEKNSDYSYSIYDLSGRIIQKGAFLLNTGQVNISFYSLATQVYILLVEDKTTKAKMASRFL